MVDLHCHILPGLDDGPTTLEVAVEMARVAEAAGIDTLVATPHIRHDHDFRIELIEERLQALRAALVDSQINLEVLAGGEVDLVRSTELDDRTLGRLCLGEGRYLLMESPYGPAPSLLERVLYDLQLRGFRPVLAHPERSPTFLRDRSRLERLVESSVLCSVTARSVTGGFGKAVRQFTLGLFADGLVHNVASDAHDPVRRAPGLSPALKRLEAEFRCVPGTARWFAEDSGRDVVAGCHLTGGPPLLEGRPSGWTRVKRRVGLA